MSFAVGESSARFCDIDSEFTTELKCNKSIEIPDIKNGNPNVQIVEGDPQQGFRFVLLTKKGGKVVLSFFRFE